jgi:hypothetical protein
MAFVVTLQQEHIPLPETLPLNKGGGEGGGGAISYFLQKAARYLLLAIRLEPRE